MDHTILVHHLKHGVTSLITEGLESQQQYTPPNRYMLEAARVIEQLTIANQQQNQYIQELQINYQQTVDQLKKLQQNDTTATE